MTTEPVAHFSSAAPRIRFLSAGYDQAGRDALEKIALEFTKAVGLINLDLNHPDTKGGLALLNRLRDACEDEVIIASPAALALAKFITAFLAEASIGANIHEVFEPLTAQAAREAISNEKRNAAQSKNLTERKYVLNAWESRTDKGQSKASFARQYVGLVKTKFLTDVTADTIARDWLPKPQK